MRSKVITLIFLSLVFNLVTCHLQFKIPTEAIDSKLYEEVIDEELCAEQISILKENPQLALHFADAGILIPKGILQGNTIDMGNYHQCISINQWLKDSEIQGKYCSIQVSLNQNYELAEFLKLPPINNEDANIRLDNETIVSLDEFNVFKGRIKAFTGIMEGNRTLSSYSRARVKLTLAVCIPKPCTTLQVFNSLLFNISTTKIQYSDIYCRLSNDKPWAPVDYVASVIFCLLAFVTLISTSYDLWHIFIKNTDPKQGNVICKSFSVYTNGRRLMTFTSGFDTVECIDGIRALAMAWVLVGHTFSTESNFANPLDTFKWVRSWQALWVLGGTYTVDTFFTLSGFLVVYTTVGKLTSKSLLKNIHLFYLNRLLRMFPLLATAVMLEASFLNRIADGPDWTAVSSQVNKCRATWWSTLLHIQNYMNPSMIYWVVTFWIIFFALTTFLMYANHPIDQVSWDNQLLSNMYNSFARTFWAIAVGSLIYACINGFAGPINWFLSLQIWKIHSRLSYAMYLFHYMLMVAINSTATAPIFFTPGLTTFKFLGHYCFSMAVSVLMVVVIDAPFSTMFKHMLNRGTKKSN